MKPSITTCRYQQGLSLVELMISILLGLFLTWGAIQAFLTGKQTYLTQQALSRVQETARMAQEFLGYDIRNAGYYGCASAEYVGGNPAASGINDGVSLLQNSTRPEYNFGAAVIGADNVAGADAGINLAEPLNPAPIAGSDVLVVHHAENHGLTLTGPATGASGVFNITSATGIGRTCPGGGTAFSGLCANDIVAITDCSRSKILQIANLSGTSITSGGNTPGNTAASWNADPYEMQPGSAVMRLETTIYYVANNPAGRPALYRKLLGQNPEELFEGVEDLQIEYGLDTNNDKQVDRYVPANQVTAAQWNAWIDTNNNGMLINDPAEQRIRSVRYSLLIRSEESILEEPQKYQFNGQDVTAQDRRLRQIVTSTVAIRSRAN